MSTPTDHPPEKTPFGVVIVAAGVGRRLGAETRKAWVRVDGKPLWWHAARRFRGLPGLEDLVLVVHADDLPALDTEEGRWLRKEACVRTCVPGGATRQDSVACGVAALDERCRHVLVHDAARPLVRPARILDLLGALQEDETAFLARDVPSTVKRVDPQGRVRETLPRQELRLAATPQGAPRRLLQRLLERAAQENRTFTDEAALLEWGGHTPRAVPDDATNIKVTTREDLLMARSLLSRSLPRIGQGYDIHRLAAGGPLVLGGLQIPADVHPVGHSDGDALLHALMDALLGSCGLGDIGEHFPDSDPALAGISSDLLLRKVLERLAERGFEPHQVDTSILLERPRLGEWKGRIKTSLQELLGLPPDRVSVKARTNEGLGAIGRGEALAVHCTVVVREKEDAGEA